MSEAKLPALPEPTGVVEIDCGPAPGGGREIMFTDGYNADQMLAYGQAAYQAGWDAALEEAAKVCEDIHDDEDFEDDLKAKYCAKAIRNRKGPQP